MATKPHSPFDRFAAEVEAFEATVLGQRPVDASHYDEDYFASDWRDGGNRYDLDTRRRIEGRHPALIKEAFAPERVLDVGCGPGFLMTLLQELGVDVDGVDFSASSRTLAPDVVRDRIMIAPVTDLPVEDRSYDLVVCREVLEHLTVLETRRAVSEICRASSRFAYVTTRFHPEPRSVLDLTTQLEVDPTHITLMTKDFLRCLFVLEGFRARLELEQKLDWADKGRVLVYERAVP